MLASGSGRPRCGGYAWRSARQPYPTRCILENIGRRVAHVELTKFALVADAHDDQVDFAFEGFVNDRRANIARLSTVSPLAASGGRSTSSGNVRFTSMT